MSRGPFAIQIEKSYLLFVEKFGNKIDAKIKFVNYIMHGQKEGEENLLQYCIQKERPKQFHSYLSCFVKKGNAEKCSKIAGLDINSWNMQKCINDTDKKFSIKKNMKEGGRFPKFLIYDELNKK